MQYRMLFVVLLLVTACYNDPEEIPGVYYSYHERGYEVIKVGNESYIHVSIYPSGKCCIDSGGWSNSEHTTNITFANWQDRLNVWYRDTIKTGFEGMSYNGNTLLRRGDIGRQYDFHKVYPNN